MFSDPAGQSLDDIRNPCETYGTHHFALVLTYHITCFLPFASAIASFVMHTKAPAQNVVYPVKSAF